MNLPGMPKLFLEAVESLSEPNMFNVALSDGEKREILGEIVENPRLYGMPTNFLEWRDAAYDAMEKMKY